jgi:ferredoxin-NADP reductase
LTLYIGSTIPLGVSTTPPSKSPFDRLLPRVLRDRIAQARRDLAAVAANLRGGEKKMPFASRRGGAPAPLAAAAEPPRPPALAGRPVRVEEVVRETADAVTLVLSDPSGLPFVFTPGQFFTVCLTLDGESVRRAYSASSSALQRSRLHLTIKRVAGGRVSNHLNDAVAPGDTLALLGPSGTFTVKPEIGARRHLVLLAGGSGITPMMSLARTLLVVEPQTRIDLVYGNRGPADIIFADALAALAAEHAGRFTVRHVLQSPPDGWEGGRGLLTRDVVEGELGRLGALPDDTAFFVCGPEPMMNEARAALLARGVDPARIHEERFTQPHLRDGKTAATPASTDRPQPITIRRRGAETTVVATPGETVLESGLRAGVAMPFSCAMGGCAACKVRLIDGEVDMEEPNCLGPDERAARFVLACVSRAKSALTVEVPQ